MNVKRGLICISLLLVLAMLAACGGGGGASSGGAPKAWGIAVPIELSTGDVGSPQIAVNASGDAFVVWVQTDTADINIWSTRYIAGYGLDTPTRISNGVTNASYPQIAIDADGNAMSVWQQSDGTINNIWANRYQ